MENQSIKTISEVFLNRFICNVNSLPWPNPTADPTAAPRLQKPQARPPDEN
ncbi:hypothetical protein D1AOALGA4SA_3875 [Olavius algarvensis Delta 1 endosymbiont]|nr:hypothetical protein D1AOALGA4SA_3875 [Olavius algarvensis Delta 1 endosymbiont]